MHPFHIFWWAVEDLNLRLPPCEDGTLTAELTARGIFLRQTAMLGKNFAANWTWLLEVLIIKKC